MKRINGFTLIELILTIVVVGIVALAASNTFLLGFQSYNDSIDRQDNQMQAKFVIEKLSRELRHAVPNSMSISSNGQCVSFVEIEATAFYLSLPLFGETTMDAILLEATDSTSNLNIVINPSAPRDLIPSNGLRNSTISSLVVSAGVSTLTLGSNNDPVFISSSVSERAFIYHPESIEYCIEANKVVRKKHASDGSLINEYQLASHVNSGSFSLDSASINQSSAVRMILIFVNDLGETTQYQHDVQVINVP